MISKQLKIGEHRKQIESFIELQDFFSCEASLLFLCVKYVKIQVSSERIQGSF